ncbi:hypothetical protein LguiA_004905 [Lonicera macranthoides]
MLYQYNYLLSSSPISRLLSFSKLLSLQTLTLTLAPPHPHSHSTMSTINLKPHAFAGNPIVSKTPNTISPTSALQTLKTLLLRGAVAEPGIDIKVLPFRKGKPLAGSSSGDSSTTPNWRLGWLSLADCKLLLPGDSEAEINLNEDSFVYLGGSNSLEEDDVVHWAIDVSDASDRLGNKLLSGRQLCFLELRTLMVATDWSDERAMADLAVAGHARALLEWHNTSQFCGHCGEKTVPMDAGRRKKCSNESCKKMVYPRVDPVVIMLVIDKENDCALLSRQSRYVPRMWSCLAGFVEPGESLEEAVRRETWEETGIEVDEVIYHSSQPWPGRKLNNTNKKVRTLLKPNTENIDTPYASTTYGKPCDHSSGSERTELIGIVSSI